MRIKFNFCISFIFLLLLGGKSYSQIYGDAEICRNSDIDYYYSISGYDDTKPVSWEPASARL